MSQQISCNVNADSQSEYHWYTRCFEHPYPVTIENYLGVMFKSPVSVTNRDFNGLSVLWIEVIPATVTAKLQFPNSVPKRPSPLVSMVTCTLVTAGSTNVSVPVAPAQYTLQPPSFIDDSTILPRSRLRECPRVVHLHTGVDGAGDSTKYLDRDSATVNTVKLAYNVSQS